MKIYWFQRQERFDFKNLSKNLELSGFNGVLFPWASNGIDYLTLIAHSIDVESTLKYMVAIRPYSVSPQYLAKINNTMNTISKDRVAINLVSGWVYEEEKKVGGIHGPITDLSSNIDRSNYLIEYVSVLNQLKENAPDFYVSVTNHVVFQKTDLNKIIVPYSWYKEKMFNLSVDKTMIHIAPIIRESQQEIENIQNNEWPQDTEFFTKDKFKYFINELEQQGFDGVLLSNSLSELETQVIFKTIKEIKSESMR